MRWVPFVLPLITLIVFLGCAGPKGGAVSRDSNVAVTLVSFGSLQGELLECG